MNYILLVVGFILLVKGADYFIDGSANIARYFNIPSLVIGLTLVTFGTNVPEAAVSITASSFGETGIAIGNVLGSNLFNLLMIVGCSGVIQTLTFKGSVLKREFPLLLFSSLLLILLSLDLVLSRIDGIILLILFTAFIYYIVATNIKSAKKLSGQDNIAISCDSTLVGISKTSSIIKASTISIIGILSIILGGRLVVTCSSTIASNFGVSDNIIGLTIVAIGTSLPELITALVAATKGESDIAIGSVIGSNIFNILFILGLSATMYPLRIDPKLIFDGICMVLATFITYLFAFKNKNITKFESGTLIFLYLSYILYLINNV
ncbi:calcium/sodium antiporter [Romboutsia sp.]|uniref:calcium/sodium antiporter n=1 Tax=Romboutsia sp. TaxID=1965302 RepID=UPI003F30CA79